MKQFVVFSFIWLLLAALGYMIGHLIFNNSGSQEFAEKGKLIYGKVTAKEPDNHQTIRFSYVVDGKQYDGRGGAQRGNPTFDQIQIGQQIVVFYLPETPEKSMAGYPQANSRFTRSGALFSAIFFPVFPMITIYGIYWAVRRLRENN